MTPQTQVSVQSGVTGQLAAPISMTNVLRGIRDGKWRDLIETVRGLPADSAAQEDAKKRLPAFTPAGVFADRRTKQTLDQHSGYCVLDFDHIDDPAGLRYALGVIRCVRAALIST